MSDAPLLPCPFCTEGKTVSTYFDHEQGDKWGYASCDACGARGPEVRTNYDRDDNAPWRAEAIAAWNRRALTDAFVVAVSDVKEHEDGSATYSFELNEDAQKGLCKLGLEFVLYCAAYELDLQYVLDNLKRLKSE